MRRVEPWARFSCERSLLAALFGMNVSTPLVMGLP